MKYNKAIVKVRILECFEKLSEENMNVTTISNILGLEKYIISRVLIEMEEDGLILRKDRRAPKLTTFGKECAKKYCKRVSSLTNFFVFQGEYKSMQDDIELIAQGISDEGFRRIAGNHITMLKNPISDMWFKGYSLPKYISEGIFEIYTVMVMEYDKPILLKSYLKIHKNKGNILLEKYDKNDEKIEYKSEYEKWSVALNKGKFIDFPIDNINFVNIYSIKTLIGINEFKIGSKYYKATFTINYL